MKGRGGGGGGGFFYASSNQIQMQFRCNWRGSFRDKDDWKVFFMTLDGIKTIVIPYVNVRIIQRPILCNNMHRW